MDIYGVAFSGATVDMSIADLIPLWISSFFSSSGTEIHSQECRSRSGRESRYS